MDRTPKEILDRLGPAGLTRALDDLLDRKELVRLASACGIQYPGMRTQSQSRERILEDLVKKARGEDARTTILRALEKTTADARKDWTTLTPEAKAGRLVDDDLLRADGNLGLHLFLVAGSPAESATDDFGGHLARERLLRIASNGTGEQPSKMRSREEARLLRQMQARDRKIGHVETQLAKARETQKSIKRDLIERKGELAESRMLVERLRKELTDAERKAQAAAIGKVDSEASKTTDTQLAKAVRKLASEHKKLAHVIDKLADERRPTPPAKEAVGAQLEALDRLREEVANAGRKELKELGSRSKRLESLLTEMRAQQEASNEKANRPSRHARPKDRSARVGVFVDVQNMYYSARLLKGKLDFDALLQAAVKERRLIKATAYLVETKETDQSQFIAMLQKRAIEVRRKTLRVRADGSMKGDWDMELALDILDAAPGLDVVVLVSGDGDFTSLVHRVKDMGPRVEVISFPRNTAKSLVEAADHFQPLDRKFMIYPKKPARKRSAKPPPDRPKS